MDDVCFFFEKERCEKPMVNENMNSPTDEQQTAEGSESKGVKAIPMGYTAEGPFFWSNLMVSEARFGLVSDQSNHPFILQLKKKMSGENHLLIQFTTEDLETEFEDSIDIWSFEQQPTIDNDDDFERDRMAWGQLYLKLICVIHQRTRAELIQNVSYRAHMEGPFGAYIRAVEEMPTDNPNKEILLHHFEKLKNVKWRRGEKEGFVYKIEGDTPNELLESFLLGAWSIFIFASQRQEIIPIGYFVSFIEEMLPQLPLVPNEAESIKQEIISEIMHLLSDLTFAPADFQEYIPLASLVVQSPRLFPLPAVRPAHVFYEKIQMADFDLQPYVPVGFTLESDHVLWIHNQRLQILKMFLEK